MTTLSVPWWRFEVYPGEVMKSHRVAMTASVIQSASPEKIAMTAPALQEPKRGRSWVVSVVLPAPWFRRRNGVLFPVEAA